MPKNKYVKQCTIMYNTNSESDRSIIDWIESESQKLGMSASEFIKNLIIEELTGDY